MLVLGISGLDRSLALKERLVPDLDPRERRMVQGLDSAAALVSPAGVLAASAQERHDGHKGTGAFPVDAIEACLRMAGATMADVDCVAHGFRYDASPALQSDERSRRWFDEVFSRRVQLDVLTAHYPAGDWARRLIGVPHHLAHAASAYHLSGFDRATVLVADGMGETESITVLAAREGELKVVRRYPAIASLGILYSVVTHYLGFLSSMDEYKVMGLAPYGDPARHAGQARELVRLGPGGRLMVPLLECDRSPVERETYRGAVRRLEELFGPARAPDAPVEQCHMDIAATLQRCLEDALVHVLRATVGSGDAAPNLCMAGGVALNCTANGVIARSGMFQDVFVQPAAGDDGSALGAALWRLRECVPAPPSRMAMPCWGEEFPAVDVEAAVAGLGDGYDVARFGEEELVDRVARLLGAGRVVAWYQGRMEFGPRALGNRSILADPRPPAMRAHLNAVVKQREEFRPFAPAVTAEAARAYFEIEPGQEHAFRHMLLVTQVRQEHRHRLPAVTHVDGSARVQVVERREAPLFWRLLRRFEALHGLPVLLNTSFNLRGQPIVRTPRDAVETFARSTMDALAIDDWLIARPEKLRLL
jgi:carbamoyltransferase